MIRRHDKPSIRQTIRKEWLDRVLHMIQSGMGAKEIPG